MSAKSSKPASIDVTALNNWRAQQAELDAHEAAEHIADKRAEVVQAHRDAISACARADQAAHAELLAKKAGEARFYVTYGNGTNLANCYSEIRAPDIETARKLAFATTRGKHAFLYAERDWQTEGGFTQAEKFNLRLVPLQPQKSQRTYDGRTMS